MYSASRSSMIEWHSTWWAISFLNFAWISLANDLTSLSTCPEVAEMRACERLHSPHINLSQFIHLNSIAPMKHFWQRFESSALSTLEPIFFAPQIGRLKIFDFVDIDSSTGSWSFRTQSCLVNLPHLGHVTPFFGLQDDALVKHLEQNLWRQLSACVAATEVWHNEQSCFEDMTEVVVYRSIAANDVTDRSALSV